MFYEEGDNINVKKYALSMHIKRPDFRSKCTKMYNILYQSKSDLWAAPNPEFRVQYKNLGLCRHIYLHAPYKSLDA